MTGADGELDRFPALSPKIDNTTVTIAVNGVTTACDTDDTDRAAGATAVDVPVDVADTTVLAAVDEAVEDPAAEDTTVEDCAAFSSGLLDVVEAAGGVDAPVTGVDREVVARAVVDAEEVAGEVGVVGVSVDAGAVAAVVSAAAVAGVVGAAVAGATGSEVAGVAFDGELELPADVVEDGDVVGSEPEVPTEVVDEGEVDWVDSAPDVPAEVVLVDAEPELPPTVVAETVEDGEVVLVEVAPAAGEEFAWVAGELSAAVLEVASSVLELLDDDPDVAAGSAWARPAPLINAAPKPTVIAELVTHVGT